MVIVVNLIGLGGCASNADVNQMIYQSPIKQKPENVSLIKSITVGQVMGGHETNPMLGPQINNANFKAALVQSLQQANLYHSFSGAPYILNADLVNLEQPLLGLNLTVIYTVHYQLKNVPKNKTIYDKNIVASYTAKVSDSLLAVKRLKLANEGAARANIEKLITDLYQLPIDSRNIYAG